MKTLVMVTKVVTPGSIQNFQNPIKVLINMDHFSCAIPKGKETILYSMTNKITLHILETPEQLLTNTANMA